MALKVQFGGNLLPVLLLCVCAVCTRADSLDSPTNIAKTVIKSSEISGEWGWWGGLLQSVSAAAAAPHYDCTML